MDLKKLQHIRELRLIERLIFKPLQLTRLSKIRNNTFEIFPV